MAQSAKNSATEKPKSESKSKGGKVENAVLPSQDVTEWLRNEWVKGWGAMEPPLAGVDLRPYVFVTRDKRGSLGGYTASAHLEVLVERLVGGKLSARGCVSEVAKLSPQELDEVFSAVTERVMQAESIKTEPNGIQGLMVLSERAPEMGRRLLDFARNLDIGRVGLWPASMVANIKNPTLVEDAKFLLSEWAAQEENASLKAASTLIEKMTAKG